MLDPSDILKSPDGDTPAGPPDAVNVPATESAGATRGPGRDPKKKKVRVVNRRGPSEIDKAIRMSNALREQARTTTRKPSEKALARGTVIRIDKAKGFGFVIDSAGEHRFFHRSSVLDGGFATLKEQQLVEFEPHSDERGARALKVRPAGAGPSGNKPAQPARPARTPAKTTTWRSNLSPFRSGGNAPESPRKR